MRRRGFLLAGMAFVLGASVGARAQDAKMARIGWIAAASAAAVKPNLDALREGLAERGWIEGRNYVLLQRYSDGAQDRIPGLAAELVAERVDVVVSQGPAIYGVHGAVKSAPVVYGFSGDPIVAGFASSLAQPIGNLTGVSHMSIELNGKRIDMLREIMPGLTRIAILANPTHPGDHLELADSQEAAKRLGIRLQYWPVRNAAELDAAFAGMESDPPQAIVAFPDAIIMQLRERIIGFGLARRIPAVSGWSAFAQSGGLLTYGPKLSESYRRLGYYVDRILKGAKPGELPIERPTVIELVVNLKTAASVGVDIPPSVLARADQVIE
jgi:putative ABC transport system substrate-binding protein